MYEEYDCSLSRLAVQSIVGRSLQDDIKTRYSHIPEFAFLPGNVYFLMALLEASNASVALDIDDAIDKFAYLNLTSFPGENVKGLATEALRLIKIMEGGYCLPLRLGSDLLKKVYSTSCEHFNRWMHAKLDEVRDLEIKYNLKDPKLMMSEPLYSTLGPVSLCGFLQEKYGSLVTEKAWSALASVLPVSNLAPTTEEGVIKSTEGRKCFHCGSPDHLRDTCPKLGRGGQNGKGKKGKQQSSGGNNDDSSVIPRPTPLVSTNLSQSGGGNPRNPFPAWRYIEPVDKTSAIVIGDVTYKWCRECCCRATGKKGYFTTSHFTAEHDTKRVTFGPPVNHSEVALIVPLADDSFVDDEIPEEDILVFSGPWHCPVIPDSSGEDYIPLGPSVWMASLQEEDDGNENLCLAVPLAESLRVDAENACAYDGKPPLCVMDLELCDLHRCDNPQCFSLGPDGFCCQSCSDGVYYTALVKCAMCQTTVGFLGEPCPHCNNILHGERVMVTSLPDQDICAFVDEDFDTTFNSSIFFSCHSRWILSPLLC